MVAPLYKQGVPEQYLMPDEEFANDTLLYYEVMPLYPQTPLFLKPGWALCIAHPGLFLMIPT
jgi:hypothetical protein